MKTLLVLASAITLSLAAAAQTPQAAAPPTTTQLSRSTHNEINDDPSPVSTTGDKTPGMAGSKKPHNPADDNPDVMQARYMALIAKRDQLAQTMSGITEFREFVSVQRQADEIRDHYAQVNGSLQHATRPSGGRGMAPGDKRQAVKNEPGTMPTPQALPTHKK
jgi:TolA-binding protein